MNTQLKNQQRKNPRFFGSTLLCALLGGGALALWLFPSDAFAITGDMVMKDQIEGIEKLFTSGYMRLGLLGICGITAIMGAVQQNVWMFMSGILAGVFAHFMKGWIETTFAYLI